MCPSMNLNQLSLSIPNSNSLNFITPTMFEIRLFYVRISPCTTATVPTHLNLRLLRNNSAVSLEINATSVATATTTLRRDRIDENAAEVTFVSTDTVRVSAGVDFEVVDGDNLLLCGSLSRFDSEWSMDCYAGGSFATPKSGISSPCFDVYVAGRWADTPVILTKMVSSSPRKRSPKYSNLDSIPEVSDDVEKDRMMIVAPNSLIHHRKLQFAGSDDEYDIERKMGHSYYPEDVYVDEDGQLSWFNAGVRVGVGIGLGMCLGLGIGVGLLMRSYQTTTRNFRRRFF
ncbi:hypothetical protein RND81_02G126400 [Saponaria officinalis]|uniref:Uncharacterized protein n=1 Tax=Saponaria officinalis TaxID=3572 RepID=A0AAW1MSP7_SAPOF